MQAGSQSASTSLAMALPRPPPRPYWRRFIRGVGVPFGVLIGVFVLATTTYWALGWLHTTGWTLLDCAYMASITLSTVGYNDVLGVTGIPGGRVVNMLIIITGLGGTLYSVSALTAVIVEGYLGAAFQEARMQRRIDRLSGHTIICGCGETGMHIVEEHTRMDVPYVVVDLDEEKLNAMARGQAGFNYIAGDAHREDVLLQAGIERASSLVAALPTDKDNLYLVVTAKFLSAELNIVTRATEHDLVRKFEAAGASSVVSPTYLGGMRIASRVLRPHVMDFLETMLRPDRQDASFSEAVIEPDSPLAGKSLAQTRLSERTGLLVAALKPPDQRDFVYSPSGTRMLEPGSVLIVLGPIEGLKTLRELTRGDSPKAMPTKSP